ncbi:MAG: TusE/DsrC/DsvC family sulfur relay protein [Planctomycetota bacterium]|jgi:tRNA 2-thiouridine synthesizing protein E
MAKDLEISGKNIEFNEDGFMLRPELWDEDVASAIAREDGIEEMGEKHWVIVRFIREYWEAQDLAPQVRRLCKVAGANVRELYKLFPLGPARGACRVAGLPKPDGCV